MYIMWGGGEAIWRGRGGRVSTGACLVLAAPSDSEAVDKPEHTHLITNTFIFCFTLSLSLSLSL